MNRNEIINFKTDTIPAELNSLPQGGCLPEEQQDMVRDNGKPAKVAVDPKKDGEASPSITGITATYYAPEVLEWCRDHFDNVFKSYLEEIEAIERGPGKIGSALGEVPPLQDLEVVLDYLESIKRLKEEINLPWVRSEILDVEQRLYRIHFLLRAINLPDLWDLEDIEATLKSIGFLMNEINLHSFEDLKNVLETLKHPSGGE